MVEKEVVAAGSPEKDTKQRDEPSESKVEKVSAAKEHVESKTAERAVHVEESNAGEDEIPPVAISTTDEDSTVAETHEAGMAAAEMTCEELLQADVVDAAAGVEAPRTTEGSAVIVPSETNMVDDEAANADVVVPEDTQPVAISMNVASMAVEEDTVKECSEMEMAEGEAENVGAIDTEGPADTEGIPQPKPDEGEGSLAVASMSSESPATTTLEEEASVDTVNECSETTLVEATNVDEVVAEALPPGAATVGDTNDEIPERKLDEEESLNVKSTEETLLVGLAAIGAAETVGNKASPEKEVAAGTPELGDKETRSGEGDITNSPDADEHNEGDPEDDDAEEFVEKNQLDESDVSLAKAVVEDAVEDETTKSATDTPVVDVEANAYGLFEDSENSINSEDPFAFREGKTLTWSGVDMVLAGKGSKPERKILDNVWGEVPQRRTTAIMGASGAGKTSLLNILAGRITSRGRISVAADLRLDNYAVDPTKLQVRKQIAFVAQEDSLQITSTPREAIRFSAKLRLPRSTTETQLDKLTSRMINELGLSHCADTMVGGALIKGISGGERKRTSIGVELVVKPALVFLDEPSSGLDSFSAVQLCQVLKKVANAGASVLFTIHQPSSEIFNSFDHLILLNMGRVMYQGAVADVPTYFVDRGHPIPFNYNPADWIMNVAQTVEMKDLEAADFFPKDNRQMAEVIAADTGRDILCTGVSRHRTDPDYDDRPVGLCTEIRMLFSREFTSLKRDTLALVARIGITIGMGVLIGVIFWDVAKSDRSKIGNVNSTFGAVVMVLLNSMFGTAQPALTAFPEERPVFLREYSTNHYSVLSYFLSRLTMEAFITFVQVLVLVVLLFFMIGFQGSFLVYLFATYALAMASTAMAVMLGCSVEDPKQGVELLPLLFVPQMLFAGFFVTPELIPSWLSWAQYLCSLTYAVRILLVEEFESCAKEDEVNCMIILRNVEANPSETWWYWLVILAIFAFFRLAALYILRAKAAKFY